MSNRVIRPAGIVLVRLRVAAMSASRPTVGASLLGRPCLRRARRGFVAPLKIPCPFQLDPERVFSSTNPVGNRPNAARSGPPRRLPRGLGVNLKDRGHEIGPAGACDPAFARYPEILQVVRGRRDPAIGAVLAVGPVHDTEVDLGVLRQP